MECVNCELNLLKKQAKINENSKAGVEVLYHIPELFSMCLSPEYYI